jgi:hypothetical protein
MQTNLRRIIHCEANLQVRLRRLCKLVLYFESRIVNKPQVFVHHEDSANSGGSPNQVNSTHDPVVRSLFPDTNTNTIDLMAPTTAPTVVAPAPVTVAIVGISTPITNIEIANAASQGGGQPLQTPQIGTSAQ